MTATVDIPVRWAGITPRDCQIKAVDAAIRAMHDGVHAPLIHMATGAGKSHAIGRLAALCHGRVVVTTPTQLLVDQLADTISVHCPNEVGRAYQHDWNLSRRVTVSCNPSLGKVLDSRSDFACWIVDEAHRAEGPELRELRERARRQITVGFTATPFRSDSRGLTMFDRLVFSYTSREAVADSVLVPFRVVRSESEGDLDEVCAEWVRSWTRPGIVSAVNVPDAEAFAAMCGGLPIHGYLPRDEQRRRVEALRTGQIPALVHVQLLTEGCDFPWLENLILRRRTASANRLVQEVGRVLRSSPGKAFATLYDPLDALGEVGLVHSAALEDAQGRESEPEDWTMEQLLALPDIPPKQKTVAISRLAGWATDMVGEMRAAGVVEPPAHGEGPWRRKKASAKQVAFLRKMAGAARYLPEQHQAAVAWLADQDSMRSGTASDLLCILGALRKAKSCPVQPPELS